jgi:large subunit ribosomal protein L7/L12
MNGGKLAMVEKATKLSKIIDQVADLTVLELSELVKALEEKFGVQAAAPMMMAGAVPAAGGEAKPAEEAPTSFDVILKEVGAQKIQVIKEVRAITSLGLKEAKDLVDGAPKPIKEGVSEDEANQIKAKIEAVGATIELKGRV